MDSSGTHELRKSAAERHQPSVVSVPIQVAAVCYRWTASGLEFLLVRTSSGKWIFPKGKLDDLLSHSEAAAREALEEAGAIGVLDPQRLLAFRYWKSGAAEDQLIIVEAFLLEVLHCREPLEADRCPTWFPALQVKRMLARGRESSASNELHRAVEAALARIQPGEAPVN